MGILDRIAGRFDELVGGDGGSGSRAADDIVQARNFAVLGDHEAAAIAFGRAADIDPTAADAWLGLGECLARLERFEPARDAFRRALTLSLPPDRRAAAQSALGQLYAKAGQWGKAIRELGRATDVRGDDAETHAAMGRALIAAGEADGADWLARAARLPGGTARLLVEAAAAKTEAGAALRLLREAVDHAPQDAAVRVALARHLVRERDLDAALTEAIAATRVGPDDAGAWSAVREVHAAADRYAEAIEAARREGTCGTAPPFSVWLALALGAEDRAAIKEALSHGQTSDRGFAEASALLAGTLDDSGVVTLARWAPRPAARRFVVRELAPPPVPAGNIYALLAWAEGLAARQRALLPLAVPMARALEAFDRPLLVAVMGEFNAGKSSFVNALAGQAVAPVGVTPTTATINVLRFGQGGGRVIYHDGTARDLGAGTVAGFLAALDDAAASAIRQVEIFAPLEALRRVEIVDTPGLNSLRPAHEKVARDFLVEADAIVWVFSAGQAAKATEREALALARAAGKRVLGVINKIDRASLDEIDEVVRHVARELADLVETVVPLSARVALAAHANGDAAAREQSGFPIVEAALESGFFSRARDLKRATAITILRRFVDDARAAVEGAPVAAGPPHAARAAILAIEQRLRSTVAAERVALRARLDDGIRAAASEVREFVRPRAWLFGEASADPEDEVFLRDLLDDGVLAATAKTRSALLGALAPAETGWVPPDPAPGLAPALVAAIDDAIERFRAYARGIMEGAAAVFFRVDLRSMRVDLPAIRNALLRWTPDPEEALFRPIERAVGAFATRARTDLDERESTAEIAEIMRREHVLGPIEALAEAVAALEPTSVTFDRPREGPES